MPIRLAVELEQYASRLGPEEFTEVLIDLHCGLHPSWTVEERNALMLTIGRSVGQRLFFGDNLILEVVSVHGKFVRLGVLSPRDLLVLREELLPPSEVAEIEARCRAGHPAPAGR